MCVYIYVYMYVCVFVYIIVSPTSVKARIWTLNEYDDDDIYIYTIYTIYKYFNQIIQIQTKYK